MIDVMQNPVVTHASPRWSFAWRRSLFLMGWWQPLLGLMGMIVLALLAQARDPIAQWIGYSAVAGVGALVGGIQGAYLFAPADEPALELLLASPRPRWVLLVERLLVIVVLNTGVAVIGAVFFTLIIPGETVVNQLIRWLPPFVLLTGFGLWIGLATQHSSYGALLIILLDGAMLFGGAAVLIERFPWVWAILLFPPVALFTPEQWAINRVAVFVIGTVFLVMAFRIASNDEQLLSAVDE